MKHYDGDIYEQFEQWWCEDGSVYSYETHLDLEEYTKKMCEIAWTNGAYCAQQNLIKDYKNVK